MEGGEGYFNIGMMKGSKGERREWKESYKYIIIYSLVTDREVTKIDME